MALQAVIDSFRDGWKHVSRRQCIAKDKMLRNQLSEKQVDETIEDSMIASDPPSTY